MNNPIKKLNKFYQISLGIFVLLLLIKVVFKPKMGSSATPSPTETRAEAENLALGEKRNQEDAVASAHVKPHPINGVYNYSKAFPDLQDVQIKAAKKNGVRPPRNREEAEKRKDELVYVGLSPYFHMDAGMKNSIPYLVPKASVLLNRIGRNFYDSLYVKGIPLHKIVVSSVLRSEEDVKHLTKTNVNASKESCHRYGTTFDICYTRFHTVSPPDGPARRLVRDDTLKYVLSEVLRDLREQEQCYVKYEVKQSCFHVTVR